MYEYKTRLGIEEIDSAGKQTIVSLFNLFQNCTHFWLDSQPEFTACLKDYHLAMILTYRQVDIVCLADYGENLTTRTGVYEIKGYLGYRNTIVYDENDNPCAASWCLGVFTDLKTGKPVRLPPEVTDTMTLDEKYDMEYLPRKVAVPEGEFVLGEPIKPSCFDIDFNQHVNNAKYIQMACESFDDFDRYARVRAEYKKSAKREDLIIPHVLQTEKAAYVTLCDEGAEPFCKIEFSQLR